MRSATAVSYDIDDIRSAAQELTEQIRAKLTLGAHSVAILHAQPEMEIGALSAALKDKLNCPVIGGTTAAGGMITNEGYHELGVVLHVLTDDNCRFAAAISDSMAEDPLGKITDTYHAAYAALKRVDASAEPKIVICVTSIVGSISSDACLAALSDACGSLPVFGYVAADDFEFSKQQVFLDGVSGGDRMAVLLIAGDVRPMFKVKNLAGRQTLEKRVVTKARDNIICEVDGKPAYEYIKEFPFIDSDTKVLWNYQFFVEMKNAADNDGVPVSRALNTFDKQTGEVTCFADVPQDSHIGLLYCDGNDVKTSTEAALTELREEVASAGGDYHYSTALIASCSLRNMFLADQKNAEGGLVERILPKELTVSGLYAFGEIAPTSMQNGKAVNRFHNATFTMCVF